MLASSLVVVLLAAIVAFGADRRGSVMGFVEGLDAALLDASFRLRGPLAPSPQVAAVAIDQASLERFGRFPFDRLVIARALDALAAAGASVVLMDIVFAEPTTPGSDAGLSESMSRAANSVVAGYFFYTDARGFVEGDAGRQGPGGVALSPKLKERTLLRSTGVQPPLGLVAEAAAGVGFLNLRAEASSPVVRRAQLLIDDGQAVSPSAALLAATLQTTGPDALGSPLFVSGSRHAPLLSHATGNLRLDSGGGAILNYPGPSAVWPGVGLADLIDQAESGRLAPLRALFEGRVVVLGPSAVGIWDRRDTPFEQAGPAYAVHAATVDNLLEDRFLGRPPTLVVLEWFLLVLLGSTAAGVVSRASVGVGVGLGAALIVALFLGSPVALSAGLWFKPVLPALGVAGTLAVGTMVRLSREMLRRNEAERHRAEVTQMFGRYVPPALVQQLLDDPTAAALGGDRRQVSILFSDVRDFTTISEGLAPADLARLLSAYLDRMSREVVRHEGMVDKFLGDGIMALFGAPMEDAEHPSHACEAALAKIEALDRFNEEQLASGAISRRLEVGIGVNSGWAAVGNLGSELRFDYTAIGDEVNLASRLEGLTKHYGVRCIISAATAEALDDSFALRELDLARVKGRATPVRIFELLGRGAAPAWVGAYEEALDAYREQDWDTAEITCLRALAERPEDGPARFLLERIHDRRDDAVQVGWDTIHAFDIK